MCLDKGDQLIQVSCQGDMAVRFRLWWLALVAFGIQLALLRLSRTELIPDIPLRFGIGITYLLLLVVIATNLRWVGSKLLGVGVLLNFLVMVANGGLMPLPADTLQQITAPEQVEHLDVGGHIAGSKSILLLKDDTALWWLSDVLIVPGYLPGPRAISVGDILIALGVLWIAAAATRASLRASPSAVPTNHSGRSSRS